MVKNEESEDSERKIGQPVKDTTHQRVYFNFHYNQLPALKRAYEAKHKKPFVHEKVTTLEIIELVFDNKEWSIERTRESSTQPLTEKQKAVLKLRRKKQLQAVKDLDDKAIDRELKEAGIEIEGD